MNLLYFLPFLTAATFAQPYWKGRVNNGFTREAVTPFTESLYKAALDGRDELINCSNYTLIDSLIRKDEAILTIDCDGKMLFAEGIMDQVNRREDLEESPPPLDDGNFTDASMHQDKLFPWFETIKGEDCTVDYLSCAVKADMVLYIFEFTCPEKCSDGTYYRFYDFSLANGNNGVTQVVDSPTMEGSLKTCTGEMKNVLLETGKNAELILRQAGVEVSDLEELSVVTGHFLELDEGTQYCMKVENADGNQAVILVSAFELEGTVPFIAAPVFADLDACLNFLRKASCYWGDQCTYGF